MGAGSPAFQSEFCALAEATAISAAAPNTTEITVLTANLLHCQISDTVRPEFLASTDRPFPE